MRRGNNVQICLRLRFIKRGPRIPKRLAVREVFQEKPRPRGTPMVVVVVVMSVTSVVVIVMVVASGSGQVGVHVFGAGDEGA